MTTNNDDPAESTAADTVVARRSVLRAAALAGTAVAASSVLAACAGGNEGNEGNAGGASDGMGGSAESSPGATADGGATIVATSEVPVGGGVILPEAKVVVTQPTKGEFKAFDAICTHKQCPVTNIEQKTINCQCHASRFSIEDGSVKAGPAPAPLPEIPIKVEDGNVLHA